MPPYTCDLTATNQQVLFQIFIPLRVKRVGSKINWKKNPQTTVYGVKEIVTLTVCLSVTNFDPNFLRTGKTQWAKFFWDIFVKK